MSQGQVDTSNPSPGPYGMPSSLPLPVRRQHNKRYRYTKTEVNQRLCQLCNLAEVGDEKHYLVRCTQSAITEERGEMLTLVHRISPQFSQLSENTRMVYLMSFIDGNIMRPVAKFLHSLLRHML